MSQYCLYFLPQNNRIGALEALIVIILWHLYRNLKPSFFVPFHSVCVTDLYMQENLVNEPLFRFFNDIFKQL